MERLSSALVLQRHELWFVLREISRIIQLVSRYDESALWAMSSDWRTIEEFGQRFRPLYSGVYKTAMSWTSSSHLLHYVTCWMLVSHQCREASCIGWDIPCEPRCASDSAGTDGRQIPIWRSETAVPSATRWEPLLGLYNWLIGHPLSHPSTIYRKRRPVVTGRPLRRRERRCWPACLGDTVACVVWRGGRLRLLRRPNRRPPR